MLKLFSNLKVCVIGEWSIKFSMSRVVIRRNCCEYIKATDVIQYEHRSAFDMTDLHTAHVRKDRVGPSHIIENDFAMTIMTK